MRIDPLDNIWVVDQMSSMVIKFDPNGACNCAIGEKWPSGLKGSRRSCSMRRRVALLAEDPRAPALRATCFNGPPTSRGMPPVTSMWPMAMATPGQLQVSDKNGKFVKSWGSKGTATGQFNSARVSALDAQGNVYVADAGNKRIQVFDGDGNFKTEIKNVGTPSAICITPGTRQALYSSNSNPPEDIDANGEIYKIDLDGKIAGRFGKAGKLPKEFGTVNAIDCRRDNESYVAEIGNWRVQKLTLHP